MEEVPRGKASRVVGKSYLYTGKEEILEDKSESLMSALTGLGWNITSPLQIEPCLLGLSNHNYKISCDNHGPLLLRVYGPTVGDSNLNEKHIHDCEFGAQVVLRLDWGRLEEWLPGRPMQRKDCGNSKVC